MEKKNTPVSELEQDILKVLVTEEEIKTRVAELGAELKARGVLVRHFNIPAIKDYLRITVGSRDECETLVARLKEIGGAK